MVKSNSRLQLMNLIDYKNKILPETFFSDSELNVIINNSTSDSEVLLIIELTHYEFRIKPFIKSPIKSLFEFVDHSDYSLSEWIRAINYFSNLLSKNNREKKLSVMLGFIECSTRSPENLILKKDLVLLIDEMIINFGYEG